MHHKTGEAFKSCLFEAVDRCGWKLHAYVIMSNHFHLVRETPDPNLVWNGTDLKELNEAMWDQFVADRMAAAGKTELDCVNDRKGADWKAKIARDLRANTTAGNIWIARRLNMGHPSRITNLIRNVS